MEELDPGRSSRAPRTVPRRTKGNSHVLVGRALDRRSTGTPVHRRRHRRVLAWLRAASRVLLPAPSSERRTVADPLGVERQPLLGIRTAELVDVVFGPPGDIGFMAARVKEFFRQTSVDLQSDAQRRLSMHTESVVDAVVMDELCRFDEWKAMLTALANQLGDWQ